MPLVWSNPLDIDFDQSKFRALVQRYTLINWHRSRAFFILAGSSSTKAGETQPINHKGRDDVVVIDKVRMNSGGARLETALIFNWLSFITLLYLGKWKR